MMSLIQQALLPLTQSIDVSCLMRPTDNLNLFIVAF